MSTTASPAHAPRTAEILDALRQAWGHGAVDALDSVLAPAFVRRGQSSRLTREQLKAAILDMRRAFPDLTMNIVDVVESPGRLAFQWTSTGTLTDSYLGLPPTGRQYSVSGANFCHVEDGLIVEESVTYDRRGEYTSLGLNLVSGSPGASARTTSPVDSDLLRQMHRSMITGVTVVSVDSAGEPRGLAVNAFASVSLEPPLVLVCIQKNSSTYAHIIAAKHFGISVLAAGQMDVAQVFATKAERKFDQVAWYRGTHGVPLLQGASATLEVALEDTLHASTHTIFIGRVQTVSTSPAAPLIYANGGFFDGSHLVPASAPAAPSAS